MACDCKWSEAIEKRLAHVESRMAAVINEARAAFFPTLSPMPAAQFMAVEPQADPAVREVLRASYAAARSAEVRGYGIDTAQFLLSDLHAAGFCIVLRKD